MASLNKVMLIGNIGQDIELKYTQSGQPITTLSIATSETFTRDNERITKTEWHKAVVFGKLAEICSKFLKKGSMIYLDGSLSTRKWQDKNGVDRYTTEILAQSVKFLGKKDDNQDGAKKTDNANENSSDYENIQATDYNEIVPF